MFLSNGKCVYSGFRNDCTEYFGELGFKCPQFYNPADYILDLISIDMIDSQMKFVKDYHIPYLHLSDTTKNVCKTYAGLNIAGLAKRSTFVIDKQGIIRIIFRDIDVKQHGKQIVESLKKINQEN